MLEHRCSPRKDVALEATLHHPQLGQVHCGTRNIGPEGAFVTGPTHRIPKESMVTLVVEMNAGKTRVAHRMRAMVVHTENGGLGLMFLKANPTFFSNIEHIDTGGESHMH